MKSVLDQPRTVTVRGQTMLFKDFVDLSEFADLNLQLLRDKEARLASVSASADDWADVAGRAERLADLCAAQDAWLAEHDAQLAVEGEAIWEAIRQLEGSCPIIPAKEGS